MFAGLVLRDPALPFKYLTRNYLARGLTVKTRAACFVRHYMQLNARFPQNFMRRALQRDVSILDMRNEGSVYGITLGLSRRDDVFEDREGELSLQFQVDGAAVFALAFSIVPGWAVESQAADVLLITRIQGAKGRYSLIDQATKSLHDIAPPALLIAALQGIAHACGINELAGVCATSQVSYAEDLSAVFTKAYDEFFMELGATRTAARFFSSPIPLKEKSLAFVKKGHKLRTREKRAFKLEVANAVCLLIRENR